MQPITKVSQRRETSHSGEPVVILGLSGDLSSTSKDAILGAHQAVRGTAKHILLDFTKVDYINSSGIAIVIQMLLHADRTGAQRIGIFGLSPHFEKVFKMVGINRYASLYPDGATALSGNRQA